MIITKHKSPQCRWIRNYKLSELGFAEHPCSSHGHAPSKIFHIEFSVIDNSECDTEKDGNDTGEQDKESNNSLKPVRFKNIFPDITLVSGIDLIDYTGIVRGIGSQLNTEFFPASAAEVGQKT